ncbi:4-amino-4-deoxy-L-arabinose transferase-like glycosyltransferase [Kitasatospora sp. MAA4]|uniref:ArnT family glycosyltransferase n=1 Tax=Kitasatospora sp. MAA4 TaxID=3035093 RepID=UPI002472FABC|nr:glycosyltransferase family 39 protein [Kitasatospora sp. MAA4]MDH6135786.1 4-amino-4-deoxy-L-arabinose transferase-like glycosyltransferase [Kitasatospora sp. MAA4]
MPTDSTTLTRLVALYARLPDRVRTGYWTRVVPVLTVLAVATHIPSFLRPVWSPDEGYLATQARMLADGGVLYDTVVDRKPPLLPWLYEACFSVFGSLSLWPLRTLAIVAHLATALLLASIARSRWGNRAGGAAGALYLLLSIGLSPEDTQAATFEVFMLPAMVAAFRYAERRRWLAAGIAVAICSLTKQTGGAVLLPVLWMLFQDARRRGVRWRPALLKIGFGFAVPIALVAVILTKPKGFLFWVVTGSGDYASLGGGAWWQMLGRALGNSAILAAAGLGFLLPLGRRLWLRYRVGRELPTAGTSRGSTGDLWIFLFSSVVAVATGFHFFGHYYLQLMPPLVLLGVGAVSVSAISWRPVLAYSMVASFAFWVLAVAWPGEQLSQTTAVATAVAARSTPKDTVLVWGMHPELYYLSDRKPVTRYLTAGFLTNFSGGKGTADVGEQYSVPDAWQTFDQEINAKGLPEIVVDDSGNAPYQPTMVPVIENLLDSHYDVVGAFGDTMVYRLRK